MCAPKTTNSFRAGIAALHDRGLDGHRILIGHLDSGVDGRHPALTDRLTAFRMVGYRGLTIEASIPVDSGQHGTHTAGLLVGGCDHGIAPAARLASAAVLEEGHLLSRILVGLDWLADLPVQILFLGFALRTTAPILHTMITQLARQDVLLIAPIGNRGAGRWGEPAGRPEVLAVGAVDPHGRIPPFSGSQNTPPDMICLKPEVVAPGVDIVSAGAGGGTSTLSGSSMAAAQVAGLAALLRGAFPTATASQIRLALTESALPLTAEQTHRAAAGIVDPLAAYQCLASGQTAPQPMASSFSLSPMPQVKQIDPRLIEQIGRGGPGARSSAIFEFEAAAAQNRLATLFSKHSEYAQIKWLTHAPTAICSAPNHLLARIMQWPEVKIASAADQDRSPL